MHVAHGCNFTCDGCTHFSNEGFGGRETPSSFRNFVAPWAKRILPSHVLLLGGEPTLNPELTEIVSIARDLWPEPAMMLVTNGWFLHKHPDLPKVLKERRVHLDVSIHHNSPDYLAQLEKVKDWASSHELIIRWRESFRDWMLYYKGVGKTAEPYTDNDPQSSWNHCPSRWCMNIHEGKLYKCPMIAYVPMHVAKYGDNNGKWALYLKYTPLSPDCTDTELRQFISKQCEAFCAMCPAHPTPHHKADPTRRKALL
jgi:MoaA/NifB/PqqE/SkfB family radical SAM enzyme